MNNMKAKPLRSVHSIVQHVPVVSDPQPVAFQQPVEFLTRWRESRRGGRFQTHTPMMRPSAFMRAGGRT